MRLLLALDIHDGAEPLLARALAWAEALDAVLDVVYVDERRAYPHALGDATLQPTLQRLWLASRGRQRIRLDALVEALPGARLGTSRVLLGRAPAQIVAAAAGRDAILVGTHGRRGAAHLFLGSVAERVVRAAPCPVIVLRDPPEG